MNLIRIKLELEIMVDGVLLKVTRKRLSRTSGYHMITIWFNLFRIKRIDLFSQIVLLIRDPRGLINSRLQMPGKRHHAAEYKQRAKGNQSMSKVIIPTVWGVQ